MTPWNPTGRTYSISTCNIPEGWSIWALLVLWKPAGRWLSLGVEQILENMLICLSNVPSGWWHTVAQNHAHLTVCTQLVKDFWSAAFSDTEPYLVKLNGRWKTPSNLLLAICHFWVLANKPNLQLIYNDLNSKESSCTLISDAFPSGFPACWGFWSYFLQPWAASLNLYPVPPSLELPYIQFSWLISLFFLPWGSRFILFLWWLLFNWQENARKHKTWIFLSFCLLGAFPYILQIPFGHGPLAFSAGWLGWPLLSLQGSSMEETGGG